MTNLETTTAASEQAKTSELAVLAFNQRLGILASVLPEVEQDGNLIRAAGEELITEFDIDPLLFEDTTHSLFFTAIAQRYSSLEATKEQLSMSHYESEKELVGDSLVLLALDKAGSYEELKELIDSENKMSGDAKEKAFDKYTQRELTEELKTAIENGLLNDCKERLGITADNEDPYDIRVLSISNGLATAGMEPFITQDALWDKNGSSTVDEYISDAEHFNKYKAGLLKRGAEFAGAFGDEARIPHAWVTVINGLRTICLPMPLAEKILYKDVTRTPYYDEDSWERDFANLEHEYVHTQGGLQLDDELYYGISFEERRAELFSNDKQGYQDIKGWLIDLSVITGFKFMKKMDDAPKGGDVDSFYMEMAAELGLQTTLELALKPPGAYVHAARKLQQDVNSRIGSFDEITERIYRQMVKDGKKDEIDARVRKFAQDTADRDLAQWANYRKTGLGLNFVTDQLTKQLAEINQAS